MPRLKYISVLIITVFCTVFHSVEAQRDSLFLADEIHRLTKFWNEYQSEISRPASGTDFTQVNRLLRLRSAAQRGYEYENQVNRVRAEMYHRDPGLSANASYMENFTPALNEDDDNLIYQRRLQAGLNWDILGTGIVSNRNKEEQLRNQIMINAFLAPADNKESSYSLNWNIIIYLFNKEKIKVLQQRKELTDELVLEAERLHLSKYLTREDYMKMLSRKAEIEALQRIYSDYNSQFNPEGDTLKIEATQLPLLDVNYVNVFKSIDTNIRDTINRLYLENLKLEQSLIHDIRVSAGLRYNFYDLVTPGYRSFFSLVLNASAPIPFNLKKREELSEAKAQLAMYNLQQRFEGKEKELLNECYEYRYKLKQYVSFHQKFLLYEELVRRMNAALRLSPLRFNPVEGLTLLDDMLAVKMELIDLQQSLYLKILRIYTKSGANRPEDIAKIFDVPNYFDIDVVTERSAYIWSSVFKKKTPAFVAEYIFFNKFDRLIISVNSDAENKKNILQLKKELKNKNIPIEAMVGDNTFIQGNISTKLTSLFSGLDSVKFTALHLDVEPHTFADWDTKKDEYIQQYMKMLEEAKTWCTARGVGLTVSIPLHYPEEMVNRIFGICDRVYFMAYENTKPEYIERKTMPYKAFGNKMIIALRNKDFQSRMAMEKHIVELYHLMSLNGIALHDLTGLIEMDERNIQR